MDSKPKMLCVVVWWSLVAATVVCDAGKLHNRENSSEQYQRMDEYLDFDKPRGSEESREWARRPAVKLQMLGAHAPKSPAKGPRGLLDADDDMLKAWAGAYGGNRLVVCQKCPDRKSSGTRGPCMSRRCPGMSWRRGWVLVRASCVDGMIVEDLRVLRTNKHERTCDTLEQDPIVMGDRARRVIWGWLQPMWRYAARYDVGLLQLDGPFNVEELTNATTAKEAIHNVEIWMEQVYGGVFGKSPNNMYDISGGTWYGLFMMGILPATLFFVFFLFVTFGTGTPQNMPYTNYKEGIVTPWMVHDFSSDVKCFPTYGQV